jgi:hypothetical protein
VVNGAEKPHFSNGVKGKAIPVQACTTGPKGSRRLILPDLQDNQHMKPQEIYLALLSVNG